MKLIEKMYCITQWTYDHRVAIVNVLLWSFFLLQVYSLCHVYTVFKRDTEFITRVNPILQEMDTTYSLRNYEVLRARLHNEVKEWDGYAE